MVRPRFRDPGLAVPQRVDLHLRTATLAAIAVSARTAAPRESCGVVVGGRGDGPTRYINITNAARNSEHSYEFDSDEFAGVLYGQEQTGEEILALVHSHPTGPPQPSAKDRTSAVPFPVIYLIVDGTVERKEMTWQHWINSGGLTAWWIQDGEAYPLVLRAVS
jgi:proteasome lid subunit RPN8/RPN11